MRRPTAPHAFAMAVSDALFLHWSFDPERLRPHVPDQLTLDTREGEAWVSLVPFVLSDAGPRFSPGFTRLSFPELNFRTYVHYEGTPGLYFFSIDVGNRFVPGLVRRATRLPCYHAEMEVDADGDYVEFHSVRDREDESPLARFAATYRPDGEVYHAERGSLDHWLAERRRLYAPRGPGVLYGDIAHDPWPLQPAEATVHGNTLFEAADLPVPQGDPETRFSEGLPMTGSVLRRLDSR